MTQGIFGLNFPLRRAPGGFLALISIGALVLATGAAMLSDDKQEHPLAWVVEQLPFWGLVGLILLVNLYPLARGLPISRSFLPVSWSVPLAMAAVLAYGPSAWVCFLVCGLSAGLAQHPRRWWSVLVAVLVDGLKGLAAGALVAGLNSVDGISVHSPGWQLVEAVAIAVLMVPLHLGVVALIRASLGEERVTIDSGDLPTIVLRGVTQLLAPIPALMAMRAPVLLALIAVCCIALHHVADLLSARTTQAVTDPLTGLANRAGLLAALSRRLGDLKRNPRPITVMILDLDEFKAVNDYGGHRWGDQVLVRTSARLLRLIRADDLVARIGGDEFAVLMSPGFSVDDAWDLVQRIGADLERPHWFGGESFVVGASIGIAWSDDANASPEDLLERADLGMYAAKMTKRGVLSDRAPGREPGWAMLKGRAGRAAVESTPGPVWSVTRPGASTWDPHLWDVPASGRDRVVGPGTH